jgi:outer membrane protein assembly factor BamB
MGAIGWRMLAIAVGLASCRSIPLSADPTAAAADEHLSPARLYAVDWWRPLVTPTLLEFQPSEGAAPAVNPDTDSIIVGTRDGYLRSLSPRDGAVEWEFKTRGSFYAGPTIVDGVVYVAGSDGFLRALTAASGKELWHWQAGEELVTAPVVVGERVLVASQAETVFAVEARSGKWQWQYRRDAPPGFTVRGAARPQVVGDQVLTGFADGHLVSLGLGDGVARWEQKLSVSGQQFLDVDTAPVAGGSEVVYVASYRDGVYALSAKGGDVLWNTARPGITSLVKTGEVLYATGDGALSAVETQQGRTLWTLDLSERTPKGRTGNSGRAPIFTRGLVLVPTSTALVFVDPTSVSVKVAWNPGRGVTATPVRSSSRRFGNRLYVLSNLGTLFALQLAGSAD